MDTSYYHNFITLIQIGNMTQAAEILHITQPALSKQLKYLEAEFGTPLINIKRGQRGSNLQLTEAGKTFYEKALLICEMEESTYNAVRAINNKIEGTLHIAASASRSTPMVQQYLPAFQMKHPSVHYEIYEGLMRDVITHLLDGSAEIGIANEQMVDKDKFEVLLTQEEHLYAIFRNDVFWTDKELESISWEEISSYPLSLSGGSVRMIMQSDLTDMDKLNVQVVTTTKSSAIEYASSGRTVALVPMDAKELVNHRKMVRHRVPEFESTFRKAFIMLKGHSLSPVAQQFIDFYKAYI